MRIVALALALACFLYPFFGFANCIGLGDAGLESRFRILDEYINKNSDKISKDDLEMLGASVYSFNYTYGKLKDARNSQFIALGIMWLSAAALLYFSAKKCNNERKNHVLRTPDRPNQPVKGS